MTTRKPKVMTTSVTSADAREYFPGECPPEIGPRAYAIVNTARPNARGPR
jgi:hypothetical protein